MQDIQRESTQDDNFPDSLSINRKEINHKNTRNRTTLFVVCIITFHMDMPKYCQMKHLHAMKN